MSRQTRCIGLIDHLKSKQNKDSKSEIKNRTKSRVKIETPGAYLRGGGSFPPRQKWREKRIVFQSWLGLTLMFDIISNLDITTESIYFFNFLKVAE